MLKTAKAVLNVLVGLVNVVLGTDPLDDRRKVEAIRLVNRAVTD